MMQMRRGKGELVGLGLPCTELRNGNVKQSCCNTDWGVDAIGLWKNSNGWYPGTMDTYEEGDSFVIEFNPEGRLIVKCEEVKFHCWMEQGGLSETDG